MGTVRILKGQYAGRFGTIIAQDDSEYSNLLIQPDGDAQAVWLAQDGEVEFN